MTHERVTICPACTTEHGGDWDLPFCAVCGADLFDVQSPSGPKDADPIGPGGPGRVLSLDEAVAIARRNTPEPQLYRVDVRVITLPMLIVAALYAFAMASLVYIVLF